MLQEGTKRRTVTEAGGNEMTETEEKEGVQEVGNAITITAMMTEGGTEDGRDLAPVLGLGPRVREVGAGIAGLVLRNHPSQWCQR